MSAWVKANVLCPFVIIRRGAVVSGQAMDSSAPATYMKRCVPINCMPVILHGYIDQREQMHTQPADSKELRIATAA